MIKAIIFDCFGVLTTDNWKEFCSVLPADMVEETRHIVHKYDSGLITQDEFTAQVASVTGHSPREVAAIFIGGPKNVILLDYIKTLKPNYRIGMLSNVASDWVRSEFLTPEEQKLFDAMVFSFEAGMAKPEPGIYEIVCQKLNIVPEQAVFIDDSPRHCVAAADLNMKTVIYEDFAQMKRELEKILADSDN